MVHDISKLNVMAINCLLFFSRDFLCSFERVLKGYKKCLQRAIFMVRVVMNVSVFFHSVLHSVSPFIFFIMYFPVSLDE